MILRRHSNQGQPGRGTKAASGGGPSPAEQILEANKPGVPCRCTKSLSLLQSRWHPDVEHNCLTLIVGREAQALAPFLTTKGFKIHPENPVSGRLEAGRYYRRFSWSHEVLRSNILRGMLFVTRNGDDFVNSRARFGFSMIWLPRLQYGDVLHERSDEDLAKAVERVLRRFDFSVNRGQCVKISFDLEKSKWIYEQIPDAIPSKF